MSLTSADIFAVTKSVTKKWEKQRKSEERGLRTRWSREYVYSDRIDFTDVAEDILPPAYLHASGEGVSPVTKRQFYYACRQRFKDETGRAITAAYFSQNLLVRYMNQHPETRSWRVVADPRGKLTIPNAGYDVRIPIGTIAIDDHLQEAAAGTGALENIAPRISIEWPSLAAGTRYRDLMYVEKEGFDPLFEQFHIAERFHLAIASGKGQSTAAMRHLADMSCATGSGSRLLTLRDMDKAGFQIAKRLTTNGDWAYDQDLVKYEFRNQIDVVDLGLRLTDVEKYDLFRHEEDACKHTSKCKCFKCQPLDQDEYGITDEEYKYLLTGKRVEINALTSPQLIDFLQTKLTLLGCHVPLIPPDSVLAEAYARALVIAAINSRIEGFLDPVMDTYATSVPPKSLRQQISRAMKGATLPWDKALYDLALTKVRRDDAE